MIELLAQSWTCIHRYHYFMYFPLLFLYFSHYLYFLLFVVRGCRKESDIKHSGLGKIPWPHVNELCTANVYVFVLFHLECMNSITFPLCVSWRQQTMIFKKENQQRINPWQNNAYELARGGRRLLLYDQTFHVLGRICTKMKGLFSYTPSAPF
jgi:hypothetical protein